VFLLPALASPAIIRLPNRAENIMFRTQSHGLVLAAILLLCMAPSAAVAQDGTLPTIRQDVREPPPSSPAPPPSADPPTSNTPREQNRVPNSTDAFLDACGNSGLLVPAVCGAGILAGMAATSPIWVPKALLDDDNFSFGGCFPRFPYDDLPGYIQTHDATAQTKPWSVRLDAEYIETFDRLDNVIGSHLLFDTASRFGLAASFNHLEENLSGGGRDQLQIGDWNLVYRFAQNDRAEFRTGLGMNWLADSRRTDLGFNFTYAVDVYPRKPWVLSATLDWGTLGHAELFRFRTTAGLVFRGIETYAGYEYTDIGRAHWNGLVAGLRVWF
jgi:hypothetical protein